MLEAIRLPCRAALASHGAPHVQNCGRGLNLHELDAIMAVCLAQEAQSLTETSHCSGSCR